MCEYCLKHGKGKKWYHNMEDFSNKLLEDRERDEFVRGHAKMHATKSISYIVPSTLPLLKYSLGLGIYSAGSYIPFLKEPAIQKINKLSEKYHFGQIVTSDEANGILEAAHNITLIDCGCRKTQGKKDLRYCIAFGAFSDYCERVPKSEVEGLDCDRALFLIEKFEKENLFHAVYTYKPPFIGVLCNCDKRYCLGYKVMKRGSQAALLKGHYVSETDTNKCSSCLDCILVCPFQARGVRENVVIMKQEKCFGCGLCKKACPENAISLVPREGISAISSI